MTVYVSIGNSDDKLTQAEWSDYVRAVHLSIEDRAARVHGAWFSATASAFQNAVWCFEIGGPEVLKDELREIAGRFDQESIAWAEAETQFLTPPAASPHITAQGIVS